MPRRYAPLVILAVLLALVGGWALWLGSPAGPPRGALVAEAPRPEPSVIAVPIELRLSDLQASLDESVPPVFVSQEGTPIAEGWLLDLDARRDGPIRVRSDGGRLVADVPVRVKAKAYSQRKAEVSAEQGRGEPAGTRVEGRLVVHAAIAYDLEDDWMMRTTTTLSHTWTSRPTLQVGPFRFGIQKLADQALDPRWPEIAAEMDARNAADPKVRLGVERAWKELSAPRVVALEPPTWWVAEPMALYASSPVVDPDALRMVVGMQGRFAFVLGDPGPVEPPPPLPPRADPPDVHGFRLAVAAHLQWPAMSEAAAASLVGTTWQRAGGEATIDAVELYPSGDRVVVALGYAAQHAWRTSGTVFVSGRPVLDPATRELRFEDVDVGVESWDEATATAGALAGRTLRQAIAEGLRFPFGPELDRVRTSVEEGLSVRTLGGDSLTGELDVLEVRGVRLTDEAVVVDALATGTLALRLPPP